MPRFDLPLEQLRDYRTDTEEPAGLDQWWQHRLEAARAAAIPPRLMLNEAEIYAPVTVHPFTGHAVPAAHVERQLRHLRDFLR
jgi:cephalosporin-C deacetylase